MAFKNVNKQQSFPALERSIVDFWQTRQIFQKSVEKDAPQGTFVFYEGPPPLTANPAFIM